MMRNKIILLAIALCSTICIQAVTYEKEDSIKVVKLLKTAKAKRYDGLVDAEMFFARSLIGLPYVAQTLEVNNKEQLVVNLRQLDCTTFVENVVALTLCIKEKRYTFSAFCNNLETIRYEKSVAVSYATRLHYFTEWIESNTKAGICKCISKPTPPFTGVQTINVNYMSRHPSKYPMLQGKTDEIEKIKKMENSINGKKHRYIPKSQIKNTRLLRNTVHTGDIIAILTNREGLDTQHIGIAVWRNDGLHLLNASSIHHKVIDEPKLFSQYLNEHKSMTGIRVVRLTDK